LAFNQTAGINNIRLRMIGIWAVSAIMLISAAHEYNKRNPSQFENVINNKGFLIRDGGMKQISKLLLQGVDSNSKILAQEAKWLKSFGKVRHDQVISVFKLPPYDIPSQKTREILRGVTHIWLKDAFLEPDNPRGTHHINLRYRLHLAEYLQTQVSAKNWQITPIKNYGALYTAPSIKLNQTRIN
jgi:hypothetical protein